jgi:hypothetical protein
LYFNVLGRYFDSAFGIEMARSVAILPIAAEVRGGPTARTVGIFVGTASAAIGMRTICLGIVETVKCWDPHCRLAV